MQTTSGRDPAGRLGVLMGLLLRRRCGPTYAPKRRTGGHLSSQPSAYPGRHRRPRWSGSTRTRMRERLFVCPSDKRQSDASAPAPDLGEASLVNIAPVLLRSRGFPRGSQRLARVHLCFSPRVVEHFPSRHDAGTRIVSKSVVPPLSWTASRVFQVRLDFLFFLASVVLCTIISLPMHEFY